MKHLLLISRDQIGERMAGPAIRYWEMAKAFSMHRPVYLLTPNACTLSHPNMTVMRLTLKNLKNALKNASALLSQSISPLEAPLAQTAGVPFILDAYDPMPIENLEFFRFDTMDRRFQIMTNSQNDMIFSMQSADFIVCANERQKDLWTGMLLALGKINPVIYDADPHFKTLIDLVPFGISSIPPKKNGIGLREKLHLREKDKVLLWGGGVWNWFDPLTLIRAVAKLREKRDDIHLVFMGIKHPRDDVAEMQMTRDAIALAKQLNLTDRSVHFNFGWRPYDERQNDLLDATCGVSTHFDNAETRFSFRTRLLDCIWSGLPMIVTDGDHFATLVHSQGLGYVVPPKDEQALAEAIEKMVDQEPLRMEMKKKIAEVKQHYYWEEVIKPIERFIDQKKAPVPQGIRLSSYIRFTTAFIKERGVLSTMQTIFKKLLNR
jgi:glycosyltransferase involved in cell wall biosynthesis